MVRPNRFLVTSRSKAKSGRLPTNAAPDPVDRLPSDAEFRPALALPQAVCQEPQQRSLSRAEPAGQLAKIVARADLLENVAARRRIGFQLAFHLAP